MDETRSRKGNGQRSFKGGKKNRLVTQVNSRTGGVVPQNPFAIMSGPMINPGFMSSGSGNRVTGQCK